MVTDSVVEQYAFQCGACDRSWTTEYTVRSATDCEGTPLTFYWRRGMRAESPSGDLIICPSCRRASVGMHLVAQHELAQHELPNETAGRT